MNQFDTNTVIGEQKKPAIQKKVESRGKPFNFGKNVEIPTTVVNLSNEDLQRVAV